MKTVVTKINFPYSKYFFTDETLKRYNDKCLVNWLTLEQTWEAICRLSSTEQDDIYFLLIPVFRYMSFQLLISAAGSTFTPSLLSAHLRPAL